MPVGFTEHGTSATCANQYLKMEFTCIRQNKFANLTHYYKFKQLRIKEITQLHTHGRINIYVYLTSTITLILTESFSLGASTEAGGIHTGHPTQ